MATLAAQTPQELASVKRMNLDEFKKKLSAGEILVVDVRGAQPYAAGHIPGAISIPLGQIGERLKELQAAGKPIVTYCA
jgi:rhodanese-related sulfurtransferase